MAHTVILTDSAFKKVKNYYPQTFLEECQYVIKVLYYFIYFSAKFLLLSALWCGVKLVGHTGSL